MYQVSDIGRVRSLKYGKVRVLRPGNNGKGYIQVDLFKDNKRQCFLVHRLVAQAFIPNDDETKTQINHRNEDKEDNKVSNLEYCTAHYNMNYNNLPFRKKNSKRIKIKELYNPELSIDDNIELFRANGIECGRTTLWQLRKELGLIESQPVRSKIKKLYNPDLTIKQNIEVFKAKGIECSRDTVWKIRKDLGLIK